MKSLRIRGCVAGLAAAAAVMAVGAPAAGAATIAPTSHNFGSVNVGASSAPQAFTLSTCTFSLTTCTLPEVVTPTPAVTPPSDFSQTNNCPPFLFGFGMSCTINVTFTPSAAGVRNGTLNAATGLSAALTGTGIGPTTPATPTTPAAGAVAGQTAKKKCKKKKRGAAAAKKKCKKKKR